MTKRTLCLIISSVCIYLLCSCDDKSKEEEVIVRGCTEFLAANYNPDAVENDGTCLYCQDFTYTNTFSEEKTATLNYNANPLALFTITEYGRSYDYDAQGCLGCKCGGCNTKLTIKNLTNNIITFSYDLVWSNSKREGDNWSYQNVVLKLPPNSETQEKEIRSMCVDASLATAQVVITSEVQIE